MFSKPTGGDSTSNPDETKVAGLARSGSSLDAPGSPDLQTNPKHPSSLLSIGLKITGNVIASSDIQIEGTIEGGVRANLLTVGETATVHGEISADDVVIHGRVVGRVYGLDIRLTTTAQVEGDIVYKTIAIEPGAHFEGTLKRQEDPLAHSSNRSATAPAPSEPDAPDTPPLAGEPASS